MGRTIDEIMRLSEDDRRYFYEANAMSTVTIRNGGLVVTLRNYTAYSFVWEKSYVQSPSRTNSGAMSNINDCKTFVTGHFKIDFSLISIDDYRAIMKMVYSGVNEFEVTCYDIVYDRQVTLKMYFATEEMPKLWTIANKIQKSPEEWEEWVDLVGVQGYTVEMIGTNNDNENFANYFN